MDLLGAKELKEEEFLSTLEIEGKQHSKFYI